MWRPRTHAEVAAAIGFLEETPQLDFKKELGGAKEIAKDVAAMTLEGGVIAYGIDEQKTIVAMALTPLPLTGTRERIQQIVNTAIHPPPAVEITLIPSAEGATEGTVIVEVPPSPLSPHMANDRYPARAGTVTRYLSEVEVARLYEQRVRLTAGAATRTPLEHYTPPEGGFDAGSGTSGIGTLRILVEPVTPQRHPLGARLGQELRAATAEATTLLDGLVRPDYFPSLLSHLEGQWKPRGTFGWSAGWATKDPQRLTLGRSGAATLTYHGGLSFEISMSVQDEEGNRWAHERLWVVETLGALTVAGFYFQGVPGVSFVYCDLGLYNLDRATRTPYGGVYTSTEPPKITDASYIESERFPVRQLAFEPEEPTWRLLERLYASFLPEPSQPFTAVRRS